MESLHLPKLRRSLGFSTNRRESLDSTFETVDMIEQIALNLTAQRLFDHLSSIQMFQPNCASESLN